MIFNVFNPWKIIRIKVCFANPILTWGWVLFATQWFWTGLSWVELWENWLLGIIQTKNKGWKWKLWAQICSEFAKSWQNFQKTGDLCTVYVLVKAWPAKKSHISLLSRRQMRLTNCHYPYLLCINFMSLCCYIQSNAKYIYLYKQLYKCKYCEATFTTTCRVKRHVRCKHDVFIYSYRNCY